MAPAWKPLRPRWRASRVQRPISSVVRDPYGCRESFNVRPSMNFRLQLRFLQGRVTMFTFPSTVMSLRKLPSFTKPRPRFILISFQVGVVDDAVSLHVAGPQGHGGGSLDRGRDTVYTGHGHDNIGAVAANAFEYCRKDYRRTRSLHPRTQACDQLKTFSR